MSGFDKLRDESNFFANQLRLSSQSFSVVTVGKIRDAITKKTHDLKLLSAKLKLLQAKTLSLAPQVINQPHEKALEEYGDIVAWKVLENVTVNSLTQAHAVKALISTPNEKLDQEMRVRKIAIINSISQYHSKESWLCHLSSVMKEKETECAELRLQWDKTLGALKNIQDQKSGNDEVNRGHLYIYLKKLVGKLELMRWLISQMVCARSPHYDWVSDPHRRISVLALTRQHHNVDMFTHDS